MRIRVMIMLMMMMIMMMMMMVHESSSCVDGSVSGGCCVPLSVYVLLCSAKCACVLQHNHTDHHNHGFHDDHYEDFNDDHDGRHQTCCFHPWIKKSIQETLA